jgi:hypothetical protein
LCIDSATQEWSVIDMLAGILHNAPMARPSHGPRRQFNLRISDVGLRILNEAARIGGINRTAVIETALREYAERRGIEYRPAPDPAREDGQ